MHFLGEDVVVDAPEPDVPAVAALHAAYPNPFSGATTVAFDLPVAQPIALSVYDVLGRRVAVLAEGEHAAAAHAVRFHARGLASGTYIVHLRLADRVLTRRLTVAR